MKNKNYKNARGLFGVIMWVLTNLKSYILFIFNIGNLCVKEGIEMEEKKNWRWKKIKKSDPCWGIKYWELFIKKE